MRIKNKINSFSSGIESLEGTGEPESDASTTTTSGAAASSVKDEIECVDGVCMRKKKK